MVRAIGHIPLKLQVSAVIALLIAAIVSLWNTSSSVIERERRRASAKAWLDSAGDALAREGRGVLSGANAPHWPEYRDPGQWTELDRALAVQASRALEPYDGVEGGYFVGDFKRFLGAAFPTQKGKQEKKKKSPPRRNPGPPRLESELVEIQVDAAIRKRQTLFVVEIVPPSTVAIRTAPVLIRGQVVAATWAMVRLPDPLFVDRSLRGYQLAAGFAMGGIGLALALTAGLARTVRRQAAERNRLQVELRRSERLAALGKLLAGVAHEVRNPLAGIRSTIQLWQRGIGPDDESFQGLIEEADRIEEIVARLLHFSRADAQDVALGDLNAVVSETARVTRAGAEAQGVVVELALEKGLPAVEHSAPALLQVLRNLTTNALHAMPDGGTLRLLTRADLAQNVVVASVSDTGPGVPPEVLAHLFEPFYTTKPGGTGLGLAIAREIALAHRGELHVEPQGGRAGATFTLTLPIAGEEPHGTSDDHAQSTDPGG